MLVLPSRIENKNARMNKNIESIFRGPASSRRGSIVNQITNPLSLNGSEEHSSSSVCSGSPLLGRTIVLHHTGLPSSTFRVVFQRKDDCPLVSNLLLNDRSPLSHYIVRRKGLQSRWEIKSLLVTHNSLYLTRDNVQGPRRRSCWSTKEMVQAIDSWPSLKIWVDFSISCFQSNKRLGPVPRSIKARPRSSYSKRPDVTLKIPNW